MPASSIPNVFKRFFGFETKATPESYLGLEWLIQDSTSGAVVTPASALKVPAVNTAISVISGTIGSLPAKIFLASNGGGKTPDKNHPAYSVVHDGANDWTTASQFRKQLTTDALMFGNGYAFANRVNNKVQELIRLDPTSIKVEVDAASGEPVYKSTGTPERIYRYQDILHIQAPVSLDAVCGISPIELGKEAIGLALVLEKHAARLFKNGGRPSGVFVFPGKPGDIALKRLSDSWHTEHSGENSGRTAFLQEDATFTPLSFNSVDTQFEQMRRLQIEEIARAFSIPPTMLFELSHGKFSNVEHMAQQFYKLTLLPWLRMWEGAYKRTLFTSDERKIYSVEFIPDDLLRADTATRATAQAQYRSMGVLTANEIRAMENRPPLPGGDVLENPYTTSGKTPDKEPATQ